MAAAMEDHDMAVLRNHGQVTVGKTLEETIQRAVFFEFTCEVLLRGGGRIQRIPGGGITAYRQ